MRYIRYNNNTGTFYLDHFTFSRALWVFKEQINDIKGSSSNLQRRKNGRIWIVQCKLLGKRSEWMWNRLSRSEKDWVIVWRDWNVLSETGRVIIIKFKGLVRVICKKEKKIMYGKGLDVGEWRTLKDFKGSRETLKGSSWNWMRLDERGWMGVKGDGKVRGKGEMWVGLDGC